MHEKDEMTKGIIEVTMYLVRTLLFYHFKSGENHEMHFQKLKLVCGD